jgi:hypothetical protein
MEIIDFDGKIAIPARFASGASRGARLEQHQKKLPHNKIAISPRGASPRSTETRWDHGFSPKPGGVAASEKFVGIREQISRQFRGFLKIMYSDLGIGQSLVPDSRMRNWRGTSRSGTSSSSFDEKAIKFADDFFRF